MNRPLFFALLLGALAFLLAIGFRSPESGCALPQPSVSPIRPLAGEAPQFQAEDMGGKTVALERLRGRWLLLNFWATWCDPCIDELPELAALAEQGARRNLSLLLLAADDERQAVPALADRFLRLAREERLEAGMAALAEKAGLMIRGEQPGVISLLDPGGQIAHRYGTEKFPETYLIDPRGGLRAIFVGPQPWRDAELQARLWQMMEP